MNQCEHGTLNCKPNNYEARVLAVHNLPIRHRVVAAITYDMEFITVKSTLCRNSKNVIICSR